MIRIQWKIVFTDKYVIGNDNQVYRLPYTSQCKTYPLRQLKLIKRETKGYWLKYNERYQWWSLIKLRSHLKKVSNGDILIDPKTLPF